MQKILLFLSPISKYLSVIVMIGAFAAGIGITRIYYLGIIDKQEAELAGKARDYLSKVIELDRQYVLKYDAINNKLAVTQRLLNEELKKPVYKCPIPIDGSRLLNNAINSRKDHQPVK